MASGRPPLTRSEMRALRPMPVKKIEQQEVAGVGVEADLDDLELVEREEEDARRGGRR